MRAEMQLTKNMTDLLTNSELEVVYVQHVAVGSFGHVDMCELMQKRVGKQVASRTVVVKRGRKFTSDARGIQMLKREAEVLKVSAPAATPGVLI